MFSFLCGAGCAMSEEPEKRWCVVGGVMPRARRVRRVSCSWRLHAFIQLFAESFQKDNFNVQFLQISRIVFGSYQVAAAGADKGGILVRTGQELTSSEVRRERMYSVA